MKKWRQKAIVQKAISYLPFGQNINYLFQKYVTKGVNLSDEYFFDRLGHAQEHILGYQRLTGKAVPTTCLEIGTGWYPIVPISFFLAGAERIYSVDISFLTSKKRLITTLRAFLHCHEAGKLRQYLAFDAARLAVLQELVREAATVTLSDLLERLRITYLIEDARQLSLPDSSVDLINSNNTFEHIYPGILQPILADFRRVVTKDGGVMSHFIDMSDHFAHFDKSISIYNFLQFSDQQWRWIDNSIQPQSRIRIYDYKKLYADLRIPITAESFRPGDLAALQAVPLAAAFAHQPLAEVAKSHCHFISDMHGVA